jgi:hypothetical protein
MKTNMGSVSMTKGMRLISFVSLALILIAIFFFWIGSPFPSSIDGLIIFSALLMLSFNTLILEHYFTKPTDVLASSIAILLTITPLKNSLTSLGVWYSIYWFYVIIIGTLSVISIILFEPNAAPELIKNSISRWLKDFVTKFGNSKILFFLLFIITLLFYVDSNSPYFLILFFYSAFILIDPWRYILKLFNRNKLETPLGIGQIFGVHSKNTFLVKLFEKRPSIRKFDFVVFKYSMDDNKDLIRKGLILDNYLLNQEQWIKVLVSDDIGNLLEGEICSSIQNLNVVYKIDKLNSNIFLDKFVGIIHEGTTISKIRFIYNSNLEISEGQLLEVIINSKKILYQLIQGTTKIEQLEQNNETGLIIGEAIQLGMWLTKETKFEKFGWLPEINTPVYFASNIDPVTITEDEYIVGTIPNTNYPVIINKITSVTHHTAILGVTGSGKSIFARNFIRQLINDENIKIICIDFTDEYQGKFADLKPVKTISTDQQEAIFKKIDFIENEISTHYNKETQSSTEERKKVSQLFYDSLKIFLTGEDKLSIFELPDVSNTIGILEYTKAFFKILFHIARREKSFGNRICIVLEEAHTVVPEFNFLGVGDKASPSLVNSIAQIALQGRKYNVGFLVIAQRTANVSKTVLTQCNSLIVFQEFDQTSKDFLSNHLSAEVANALPNLKFRNAIAVGKAFRSNVPLIFEVPYIHEP